MLSSSSSIPALLLAVLAAAASAASLQEMEQELLGKDWPKANARYETLNSIKALQPAVKVDLITPIKQAVEMGGAQVVPIHFTDSAAAITKLLGSLNGVLFTGGGAELTDGSPYFDAVTTIYDYVVSQNAAGDFFPLWGTCLGFQSIVRAQSRDPHILGTFDAWNITLPLAFTPQAVKSKLFSSVYHPNAPYIVDILAHDNVTMNNHHAGVTPAAFAANERLSSFFDVLATNVDRNGKAFVSLIIGKAFPITAAQFHPEKTMFEWTPTEVTDHSARSVLANTFFMDYFVSLTHCSGHAFPPGADIPLLIYNDQPRYVHDADFEQVYVWSAPPPAPAAAQQQFLGGAHGGM